MKTKAFSTASVYVGTYTKYAGGSLAGEWMNPADYDSKEEFIEACRELHADEEAPELMFQEWENIPEGLISECGISSALFELMELLSEEEEDAFTEWAEFRNEDITEEPAKSVDIFRDHYCGEWESEEDYAEALFNECYAHDIPEGARYYIDYARFARDLFMSDYDYYGGYVFRCY